MRARAAAQLAVRSARFSACAGFGSPSPFLLIPLGLSIAPRFEAAAPVNVLSTGLNRSSGARKRLTYAVRAGWRMTRDQVSYANWRFRRHHVAIFGYWKAKKPSPLQCRGIAAHPDMVRG